MDRADPRDRLSSIEFPPRFEILEELASSEAEVLFRARDTLLDREVVLKAPGPGLEEAFRDKRTREIVLREARSLARIQHPGIERLLDVLATRTGPVLVLEPAPGEPLGARLEREGPLPPDELVNYARRLAEALDAVHSAGLVHRGIEADYVYVTSQGPRLAGFRFAKDRREGRGLKPTLRYSATIGRVKALPAHPAPEQKLGQTADARTDLFSLGWVLYECATGEPPWTAKNPLEWKDPPDASEKRPEVPRAFARLLVRCLQPSPMQRFGSARELLDSLDGIDRGDASASEPGPARDAAAAAPRARRSPVPAVAAVLALVVVALLLVLRWLPERGGTRGTAIGETEVEGSGAREAAAGYAPVYTARHALLIGIGRAYEGVPDFPPLSNARRDVEALAQRLAELPGDWEVRTLLDERADRASMIDEMAALAARSQPDDQVFVYFAGHGVPRPVSEKGGFLIPADASDRQSSWVPFDTLFHVFEDAPAKHVLVAMDCCYGGNLVASRSSSDQAFSEAFLTREAHVVMTSGFAGEQVSDGLPGGHSPFARAFLDGLAGEGAITSTQLFARIQSDLLGQGAGQTPAFGAPDNKIGEFVFFR